jgi:DNA-binding response OmpR family regulator
LPTDKGVYGEKDFLKEKMPQQDEQSVERQGFTEQVREVLADPMNDHRILIVEDDGDIAAFLQQELGKYFQTETASDGEEALQRLNDDCQLVITDAMMPRMNGFELLRRMRKDERLRHLPVIMLTALDGEDQQMKGMEVGADAYITKPFSVPLLLLQCRNLLQRSDSLRRSVAREMDDGLAAGEDAKREKAMAAAQVIVEERDQKLLAQLSVWVDSHLAAPDLSVDRFAEVMGYGRSTFYTKLKTLTGQTPNEYIKERRLQKAYELLADEHVTVAEAAYQVGMATPQYLSTTFKKRFGITPTQYQKGNQTA